MSTVVLADRFPPFVAEQLRALLPEDVRLDALQVERQEELESCARDVDVLVTARVRIGARALELVPRLRFVQQLGVGYDNLDLEAIQAAGVLASNNPGFNATAVAEHTIALMLLLLHRFVEGLDATRSGAFPTTAFIGANQRVIRELGEETVGLVGFGNIGQAVAARLTGFDTRVLYHARHRVDPGIEARLRVRYAAFDELLAASSLISLHLPSSPETRYLVGAAELAQMQPTAFLINTSRGDLVDERALRQAITSGQLAGAGLDVLENESSDVNPFADLPQVAVTPHFAGISKSSLPRALQQAAANIRRYVGGEAPLNLVTR
jgi:lactate dehydrogenase-like 2-hydroxyacid dehydrogenase